MSYYVFKKVDIIEGIKDIFDEVSCEIESETDGKIKGYFEKISYVSNYSLAEAAKVLSQIPINTLLPKENMELEQGTKRMDVETHVEYKYVLISDKLHYRVLTLEYSKFYPIKIHLTDQLFSETKEFVVDNKTQFIDIITKIFGSEEFNKIINRMLITSESIRD